MPYNALIVAVMQPRVYRATKYLSPTHVVKVTRKRFKGKLLTRKARQETLLVTVGRPNFRERQFIKACQKSGEPFPVKKIQVQILSLLLFLAIFPFAPPTHPAWNQLCRDLPKQTAATISAEEAAAIKELFGLSVVGAADNVLSASSVNDACANYAAYHQGV